MANISVILEHVRRVSLNLCLTALVVVLCIGINILSIPFLAREYPIYVNHTEAVAVRAEQMSRPWQDLVVATPVVEELLMRGPIFLILLLLSYVGLAEQRRYKYLLYSMIILAGAWFGIAHVLNGGVYVAPSKIVSISLQGVLLGALMLRTRNIIYPVLAHGGINALMLGMG